MSYNCWSGRAGDRLPSHASGETLSSSGMRASDRHLRCTPFLETALLAVHSCDWFARLANRTSGNHGGWFIGLHAKLFVVSFLKNRSLLGGACTELLKQASQKKHLSTPILQCVCPPPPPPLLGSNSSDRKSTGYHRPGLLPLYRLDGNYPRLAHGSSYADASDLLTQYRQRTDWWYSRSSSWWPIPFTRSGSLHPNRYR